jgi:hypothetical protein
MDEMEAGHLCGSGFRQMPGFVIATREILRRQRRPLWRQVPG